MARADTRDFQECKNAYMDNVTDNAPMYIAFECHKYIYGNT